MTVPSVPTAEEFAKARLALAGIHPRRPDTAIIKHVDPCPICETKAAVLATLASAEAAIERLSTEAARWNAVRAKATTGSTLQVWEGGSRNFRYWMIQIPRDGEDESVDEAADRLAGVSPPESEKP